MRNFFLVLLIMLLPITLPARQVFTRVSDIGATHIQHTGLNGKGFGRAVSGAGDFNGDGFCDVVVSAHLYKPEGFMAGDRNGAVFIISGEILDLNPDAIDVSLPEFKGMTVVGPELTQVGSMVTHVGDFNGDGLDDIALGSMENLHGYILFGQTELKQLVSLTDIQEKGVQILNTGFTVASAGDLNGDGFADVAFSDLTPESGRNDTSISRVTFVFGREDPVSPIDPLIPGPTHFTLRSASGAMIGHHISGGFDLNRDGLSDILVTSNKEGQQNDGRAYIIRGMQEFDKSVETPLILDGANQFVRNGEDLNGDGYPDLLIGLSEAGKRESTLILWGGSALRGTLRVNRIRGESRVTLLHGAFSCYGVGDLNGDGFKDLAVALPQANVGGMVFAGRVIFIYGQEEWPAEINIADLENGRETWLSYTVVDGVAAFSKFGDSIAGLGDIQGDGFDDVIIGAPEEKLLQTKNGSAYIIQGKSLFFGLQTQRSLFLSQE